MSEKKTSKLLIFIGLLVAVGLAFAIITMTEEKEKPKEQDGPDIIIKTQPEIEPEEEVKAVPKPVEPKEEVKVVPKPVKPKEEVKVVPKPVEPKEEVKAEPKPIEPILPSWETFESEDKVTGKKTAIAYSPNSYPEQKMKPPYSELKGWIAVSCNSSSEWAYLGFSEAPKIAKITKKDGYDKMIAKVKWNDKLENLVLTQKWGDRFLNFKESFFAVKNIEKFSSVLLELDWQNQSPVYFKFTLNGSPAALKKIRGMCAKY